MLHYEGECVLTRLTISGGEKARHSLDQEEPRVSDCPLWTIATLQDLNLELLPLFNFILIIIGSWVNIYATSVYVEVGGQLWGVCPLPQGSEGQSVKSVFHCCDTTPWPRFIWDWGLQRDKNPSPLRFGRISWELASQTVSREWRELTGNAAGFWNLRAHPRWHSFSSKVTPPKSPKQLH